MPPRRLKKKSIKRLVEKCVAKAIEEYEKSRANLDSAGSSGGNPGNAGGTMNVHGCSHKTLHMKVECMQCALCIGDANPIHNIGDYSKPGHEGYRNTIELPVWNNVCEIDRAAGGKLRNKNVDESWEIIENLALYDHEGWNDTKEFVKLVKSISTPQSTSKTHDRRPLELEDQINFLLNGSRPTPRPSSTHIPQAYAEAVYSNPHPQDKSEPPKQNPFTLRERTGPNPQPQALETTFEAQVRDYMAAHTERMKRFKNAIFKQHEEINDKMTKMFGLFKEPTTSRTLRKEEEERSDKTDVTPDNTEIPTETKVPVKEVEMNNEAENEPIKMAEKEEMT
ncbi:hypothetical protein Tco_0084606 [Tanacetum coccineum]